MILTPFETCKGLRLTSLINWFYKNSCGVGKESDLT